MAEGERRLAAIRFTDMIGFTAISQKNKSHAQQLLKEQRSLVRPGFPRRYKDSPENKGSMSAMS